MEMPAAAVLFLVFLCVHRSSARELRPSDHGLGSQKNATFSTPAMAAFFSGAGQTAAAAVPPARNATAVGKAAPVEGGAAPMVVLDGRDRVRTVLLTAGVVCATVGVALLAAVATAFVVQVRRRDGAAAAG